MKHNELTTSLTALALLLGGATVGCARLSYEEIGSDYNSTSQEVGATASPGKAGDAPLANTGGVGNADDSDDINVAGGVNDPFGTAANAGVKFAESSCGDGQLNVDEDCDDSVESVACNFNCTFSSCGDGITNATASEQCDDSGQSAACNSNCSFSACGDSIANSDAGEACDTGGESAICDSDCSAVSCGDGLTNVSAGESCDTSGQSATCDGDCTAPVCGDNLVNVFAGETCDTGGESATCDSDCSAVSCGDGLVNTLAGEACEPGVDTNCLGTCQYSYLAFIQNRFSFSETGTSLNDSEGGPPGTVSGTFLTGSGELSLAGGGQYGTLPPEVISSLTNATVEVWVTWTGSNNWERVFDFGTADPSGPDMHARNYFALTPRNGNGKMRIALSDGPSNADVVVELGFAMSAVKTHVAVVVDDDIDVMQVYVNGSLEGSAPLVIGLSAVDDLNNYLGRSQFSYDPYFTGTIHEFRIYHRALSAAQVLSSFSAGENP